MSRTYANKNRASGLVGGGAMCVAFDMLNTFQANTEDIKSTLMIPLCLSRSEGNAGALDVGSDGYVIGQNTLRKVPCGSYIIHVFDFLAEATAAASAISASLMMSSYPGAATQFRTTELCGGEGVMIMKIRGVVRPDFAFEGEGGAVSVAVNDHRRSCASRKRISISINWSRQDVLRYLDGCVAANLNQYDRAETIHSFIRETVNDQTCLSLLQQKLEKMPGAYVALSGVSADQVIEEVEDLMAEMDISDDLPSVGIVHMMIQSRIHNSECTSGEKIVQSVANSLMEKLYLEPRRSA